MYAVGVLPHCTIPHLFSNVWLHLPIYHDNCFGDWHGSSWVFCGTLASEFRFSCFSSMKIIGTCHHCTNSNFSFIEKYWFLMEAFRVLFQGSLVHKEHSVKIYWHWTSSWWPHSSQSSCVYQTCPACLIQRLSTFLFNWQEFSFLNALISCWLLFLYVQINSSTYVCLFILNYLFFLGLEIQNSCPFRRELTNTLISQWITIKTSIRLI